MPPTGALVMRTAPTVGTVAVLPFTLWLALAVKAWVRRPRRATSPPALVMAAPFGVSALAAMPMPSVSLSAATTM